MEVLEKVRGEVLERGTRALLAVPADVREDEDVQGLTCRFREEVGDVVRLVTNSGIGEPSTPVWDVTPEEWDDTFARECSRRVPVLSCAVLGNMLSGCRQRGSDGPMSGKRPLPDPSPYCASKTALIGMVRTVAHETGEAGVRVKLVSPGVVDGERIEWVIQAQAEQVGGHRTRRVRGSRRTRRSNAWCRARDVAETVSFLASDRSASITGEDVNV